MTPDRSREQLLAEMEELRYRLEEAEETLQAIQTGAVDALVISKPEGEHIFTLEGAEHPYRVLVESMNEGAATLSEAGDILYCNRRLAAMLQVPLEKLFGTQLVSRVAPPDQPLFAHRLKTCTLESDRPEISLVTADGSLLPVLFSCCAMEVSGVPGIGVVLTDIRYQKQVEGQLREAQIQARLAEERERAAEVLWESEQKFRSLFQSSPDAVFLTIADGGIVAANPAACTMFGMTEEEICRVGHQELSDPEDPRHALVVAERQRTGRAVKAELTYIRKNGERFPAEMDSIILSHDSPQSFVILREITERKRAEEALRLSEENFSLAFANNPAAIALTRLEDGLVLEVNDTWLTLNGWSRAEAVGRSAPTLQIWPNRKAAQWFVSELKRAGSVNGWEQQFHKRSGEPYTAQLSAQILTVRGETLILSTLIDITERKQAEDDLRAAHGRINAILEQMSDGFTSFDKEWRYTHVNSAAAKAFKVEPEKLLGKSIWEMWPAAYDLPVGVTFRRSVEENVSITFETYYPSPLDRWFECRCHPTTEGLATFFTDISDRKRERDELAAAKERLQQVLASITDGYFVLDEEWRVITLNHVAEGHFRRSAGEMIGRRIWDIAGERSPLRQRFQQAASTKEPVSFETESHLDPGVWAEMHVYPRRNILEVYFRNITERKQAEEAVRASEARLRGILDAATEESIWLFDREGTILLCNAVAARRVGKAPEELIGQQPGAFTPPEANEPRMARLHQVFETGLPLQFEDEHSGISFHHSFCPVNDANGNLAWLASFTRDITEQKRAEEALKKLNEELEERVALRTAELREKDQMLMVQARQAAMGEMISNIAHQWRQPLNALGLVVQQLLLIHDLGKLDRVYLEDSVNRSIDLVKYMSATIDDFRNYFKPDKKRIRFRVRKQIDKMLALVGDSFRQQRITIDVDVKDDPLVYGYANEFAQVLLNILNNARDAFTERGIGHPTITITAGSDADRTVIIIADNAGGIPEAFLDKIFDPYFTTKGPQVGTGVGLYMSKSIIEKNMGGRIFARNTANGAEFRIEV